MPEKPPDKPADALKDPLLELSTQASGEVERFKNETQDILGSIPKINPEYSAAIQAVEVFGKGFENLKEKLFTVPAIDFGVSEKLKAVLGDMPKLDASLIALRDMEMPEYTLPVMPVMDLPPSPQAVTAKGFRNLSAQLEGLTEAVVTLHAATVTLANEAAKDDRRMVRMTRALVALTLIIVVLTVILAVR